MLNHILSALDDYVLAFNRDENKYSFISNNIVELAGYTAADFEKDTGLWRHITDQRDIWQLKAGDALTEGVHHDFTYRITTAGGKTKWVTEKLSLFHDDRTSSKIAVSIIKDIQRQDETKYNQEESMAGYSILFDNNPSPMLVYELTTLRILKVNAAVIETYGYTRDELLTMTMRDLQPNTSPGDESEYDIISLLNGFNKLRKHRTKKGESIYVEITSDNINYKDQDSRMLIVNNVTEKIRWREEVKLREQFLNSLIDSQTNFMIRVDVNGNYTFINKQFTKVFGYHKYEVVGKHFTFTAIPEEEQLCRAAFEECIRNPGKVTHLVHHKPDKQHKLHTTEWELIAIKNESGQVTGVQGIGQDITEKVTAQKQIKETKSNLEALINNTEDLIWSVDRNYCYLYMNQAYKKAVKAHPGILEPQKGETSMHEAMGADQLKMWEDYYDRGLKGERYIVLTEDDRTTGEDISYYETGFNPIYNDKGDITGVGCFARNITEHVKATRAITAKNEQLQNIASISSHELRRPVATMIGLINILDKENFYNPENKQIIEHILTVGVEIDDVIRLIVDSAFTEARADV